MRLLVILCVFLGCFVFNNPFYGQSFIFGQLQGSPVMNTSGWNLNGNAYVGDTPGDNDNFNNELILTNANGNQSGGVFFAQPLNLGICSQWTVDFEYRIWGGSAADGLAFCFLQVPPAGFVGGGGIGIPGTANGLKVVLDTWDNGCGANPELQIFSGVGYNECIAGIVKLTNIAGNLNFIRGNTYRPVRIIYNNGQISLLINNTLYLTANFPINFAGYMGFTASTGGASDQHSIRNVVIYTAQATSNAGANVQTCSNDPVTLGTAPNPNYNYSWSPSNGLSSTSVSNPVATIVNNSAVPITQSYVVSTTLASNPGACPTTDTVLVTINPTWTTSQSDTICDGSAYNFNGTMITTSGYYVDTLSSQHGCDSITTLQIVISNNPVVSSSDATLCVGDSVLLIPSGAASYTWNPMTNAVNNLGEMMVSPASTTVYIVQGTNIDGCSDSDTVTVTVNPIPPTQLVSNDNAVCPNEPVVFTASGAASYSWLGWNLNGAVGSSHTVPASASGWCQVIGTSSFGCIASDSTYVTVNPAPILTVSPLLSEICLGEPVSIAVNGADNYQWSNGASGTNFTSFPIQSETLTILGFNIYGCSDTVISDIVVHPNPIASISVANSNLQSDDPTGTFMNNSSNFNQAVWNFGDGTFLNSNLVDVQHTFPMEDGVYSVSLTVTSLFGCTDSTSIAIEVSGDPIYYVPNTFTPDGNEYNHIFQPIFTSGFDPTDYELLIYNRWGELVFESLSPYDGWAGYYAGVAAPIGTYSYTITYFNKKEGRLKVLTGHLNLIR
jgi:gliding motility-associated-like protein